MQFLVYLAVLMVAISTVLLEVHWLTSPAPQPKPPAQTTQPALAQQPAAAPQRQKKNSAETTGSAVREGNTRQMTADPPNAANRADNSQQTAQGSSSNRCDVQACASAYRSFRVSD